MSWASLSWFCNTVLHNKKFKNQEHLSRTSAFYHIITVCKSRAKSQVIPLEFLHKLWSLTLNITLWEFPGGPVVRSPSFHHQGAQVRSLVQELISQKPPSAGLKKQTKQNNNQKTPHFSASLSPLLPRPRPVNSIACRLSCSVVSVINIKPYALLY